jgi:hypothetical protein
MEQSLRLPATKVLADDTLDGAGLVQCLCDAGRSGAMCERDGDAIRSVNNSDLKYTRAEYAQSVIGAALGTLCGVLLIGGLVYWMRQRRDKDIGPKKTSDRDSSIHSFGAPYVSEQRRYTAGPFIDQAAFDPNTSVPSPYPQDVSNTKLFPFDLAAPDVANVDEGLEQADDSADVTDSIHHIDLHGVSNMHDDDATQGNREYDDQVPIIIDEEPDTEVSRYLRAAHTYTARLPDELGLESSDIVYLLKSYDDGWARGYNLTTGKEGVFPLAFVKSTATATTDED